MFLFPATTPASKWENLVNTIFTMIFWLSVCTAIAYFMHANALRYVDAQRARSTTHTQSERFDSNSMQTNIPKVDPYLN